MPVLQSTEKLKRDYFWNYLLFVLLLIYRLFCVVCDEVLFFLVFMYLEDWNVTLPGLERTNVDPTGLKLPSLCPVSGRIKSTLPHLAVLFFRHSCHVTYTRHELSMWPRMALPPQTCVTMLTWNSHLGTTEQIYSNYIRYKL